MPADDLVKSALAAGPSVVGRSKRLYRIDDERFLVELTPSLRSFTFARDELVPGSDELRLDFYELAAQRLQQAGISVAFIKRVGPTMCIVRRCTDPPFEVIVKNAAQGSTTRKYPGLFPEGFRFTHPVVKFDYRIDPEDEPIAEDYVREAGLDPERLKRLALDVNSILREWLDPLDLLDFCIVVGEATDGAYTVTSEISPDSMRLRSEDGRSLDKDLFRRGASPRDILAEWRSLIDLVGEPSFQRMY